jgi:hypothetical protein
MKKLIFKYIVAFVTLPLLAFLPSACTSVDGIPGASQDELSSEGSAVFVRPQDYTIFFGTRSLSNYIEITYSQRYVNKAGQMVVEMGIRNRGSVSWYNFLNSAPNKIVIMAKANFYKTSQQGHGPSSTPIYSTNDRKFVIKRGQIVAARFVCPVKSAKSYQVVLSQVVPLQ